MKLKEVLQKTTQFFQEKGFPSPRLDAEILLCHGLGLRRIDLYLKFDQPLTEIEMQKCRDLVRRRSTGEPVAYILHEQGFFRRIFHVQPGVLIPRPETELLVEKVLEFAGKNQLNEPLSIVDLGTGSGCIGLTLALELPQSKVKLVDISKQALEVARINLQKFEMQNQVQVEESDAISVQGEFDIIVANPPYIDEKDLRVEKHVRQFEPSTALFAEQQGLQFLKDWSSHHFKNLNPGGLMIFEMGCDQGLAMREHFEKIGFQNVEVIKDYGGLDRFIVGVKHG